MSNPNERDQAVFRQVWPSWLGAPNDWGARRVAEYREHCVKVERERVLATFETFLAEALTTVENCVGKPESVLYEFELRALIAQLRSEP